MEITHNLLEEQIRKGIEEYNIEYIKRCKEQNDKMTKEMEETLEYLKEKSEHKKGTIDLSKIKPPKYPMCYDCWFENKED